MFRIPKTQPTLPEPDELKEKKGGLKEMANTETENTRTPEEKDHHQPKTRELRRTRNLYC